jgi:hypothetical protein
VAGCIGLPAIGAVFAANHVIRQADAEFHARMAQDAQSMEASDSAARAASQPERVGAAAGEPSQGRRRIKRSGEKAGNSNMPN